MVNIVLIGGILLLQAVIIGAVIVLSIHQRSLTQALANIRKGQEGWDGGQENRARELERNLTAQIQQIQEAWQTWQATEAQRIEELAHQYETISTQLQVEHEVALLRRVEDMPVPSNMRTQHHPPFADWRPARLGRTNLSQRDLSHRYLAGADLHTAQLTGTNFGMADLSGADLAEANLSGANLIGANLAGANLRNAILIGADLLVADLNQAVLIGANLLGVHNLTIEQLASAITDRTTQLDAEVELHLPDRPGDG